MGKSDVLDFLIRTLTCFGPILTVIWDFGVGDGSGKETVTDSDVCVQEYGGGSWPVG